MGGKNTQVYAAQGVGDEITFSSCIPDFIQEQVIWRVIRVVSNDLLDHFPRSLLMEERENLDPLEFLITLICQSQIFTLNIVFPLTDFPSFQK